MEDPATNQRFVPEDDDPPYDGAEGRWVCANSFTGNFSFGRFECFRCPNKWMSSRAQAIYQLDACVNCKIWCLPYSMWQINKK
jgi:hypothetical protein